jgi:hypothetical protein
MKKIKYFLIVPVFLISIFFQIKTVLAKFSNEEDYALEAISESGIDIEGGNDFNSAPLVSPGVYQGNMLADDSYYNRISKTKDSQGNQIVRPQKLIFFKIKLELGQKITALLNAKREVAINTDNQCAAMLPVVKIYGPGSKEYDNPNDTWENYGEVAKDQALFPISDVLFAQYPILAKDASSFQSVKAQYPYPEFVYEEKLYQGASREGYYFVSVGAEWFDKCAADPGDPVGYSEDRANSDYILEGKRLREEQKRNDKLFFKLKIMVEGSTKEYIASRRAEAEAGGIIDPDQAEALARGLDPYYASESNDQYNRGADLNGEDYFDEENSFSDWLNNILIGIASVVFLGGMITAGVIFWRNKNRGQVVLDSNYSQPSPNVPASDLCAVCGDAITSEMVFCGKCGNKLK